MAMKKFKGAGVARKASYKCVFKCPDCNNIYSAYRKQKQTTPGRYKGGHLKKLWCFKCKEEKNHIQLDSVDAKYYY